MERENEHRLTELEQKSLRSEKRLDKLEKIADVEHRLTEVEGRSKSNTKRLDKVEKVTEVIYTIQNTLVVLVEQMKDTKKSVQKLEGKVDTIEKEPVDDYKHYKKTIWTAIISTVVGAIIGALISLII